ncbi:MAG: MFS transporter [Caldiserica bacterium]|nr:MFS transporter [Caldisericota bacterium]
MRKLRMNRWVVLAVLFLISVLHQADRLLIGPLTTSIMNAFNINEAQMGAALSGALLVAGVLFPVWGYLFDRYSRARLIALAAAIWGATTWFSAISPSYGWFVATRASTGIDDASYPGVYSLLSDYFVPRIRGRVYSLLKLAMPLGYVLGAVLATTLGVRFGWRNVFRFTGSMGLVLAVLILLLVRDVPRGATEPGFKDLTEIKDARFSWTTARGLLKRKTLVALYAQGFFAVFPINVVTGDRLFEKNSRGRLIAGAATLIGAVLLIMALFVPRENVLTFSMLVAVGSFFSSFAAPNVGAAICDVSLPEVRSTSLAIQSLIETLGSALAPLVAGLLAAKSDLRTAFIIIIACATVLWTPCYGIAIANVSHDIEQTRAELLSRKDHC